MKGEIKGSIPFVATKMEMEYDEKVYPHVWGRMLV